MDFNAFWLIYFQFIGSLCISDVLAIPAPCCKAFHNFSTQDLSLHSACCESSSIYPQLISCYFVEEPLSPGCSWLYRHPSYFHSAVYFFPVVCIVTLCLDVFPYLSFVLFILPCAWMNVQSYCWSLKTLLFYFNGDMSIWSYERKKEQGKKYMGLKGLCCPVKCKHCCLFLSPVMPCSEVRLFNRSNSSKANSMSQEQKWKANKTNV